MGGALTRTLGRNSSSSTVDGTQGSTNAGILAAVYFTVSGTTPTIVGQKNVASITRNGTGNYRVTFTSSLANTNYGLIGGGRYADSGSDESVLVAPSRNSSGGINTYSTTTVDVICMTAAGTAADPIQCGVVIFDPASVGSDYLAACSVTVSGTTPTLQRQTNVSSVPRKATGVYEPTFTSAVGNSDYGAFGTSRYGDFTNEANPFFGRNRNSTSGFNQQTTGLIDLDVGTSANNGFSLANFDPVRFSMIIKNGDVAPRGTVAAARFTVSGGVVTLGRQWNVASVTRQGAGLYRIAFTTPIIDTDYVVIGTGKWGDFSNDDTPLVGTNRNNSASRNVKSTSAVDIAVRAWGSGASTFDVDAADIWIVKPWLM